MGRLTNLKPAVQMLAGHTSTLGGWSAPQRGTAAERGYGWQWRKVRNQVMRRDSYRCQCSECKKSGRILPAHEVDHKVPKAQGGTDDPSNLQAINRDCHKRKTQAEGRGG